MKGAVLLICLMIIGCDRDGRAPVRTNAPGNAEDLVQANKEAVKLEQHDIKLYAQRHGLTLTPTGTGVHLQMIRDAEGPTARPDQWARVNYRLELLNGDTAYSTEPGRPESFMVEMDQVESGLHEAIQLMGAGDSAIIVIPSYRAHGLIGDQDRIPMRSSIVYRLGVVAITDRP
ncbi:MAG: FKBP-type peptidyl-prolyl cis-trans isomerase [Flavobacteriales bacterium]|nr:FKBP-type peptidyl-prolyl cis-trans isomerase [Flavobacteriales bacterium]